MGSASHRTPEYQAIWVRFTAAAMPWRQYLRWIFEPPAKWHMSIAAPPSDAMEPNGKAIAPTGSCRHAQAADKRRHK